MKIPHHIFSPSNIGLPYAKEIKEYMGSPGLWVQEHDVELGPEASRRFEQYILKEPGRIHAAPYLYMVKDDRTQKEIGLAWIHRKLQPAPLDQFPRKIRTGFINYLPGPKRPVKIVFSFAVPIQGGEPESEYYGLGCTYIPRRLWNRVEAEVVDIDWIMLDTRLSQATMKLGEKALLHWDCLASHANIHGAHLGVAVRKAVKA